jgi:importin subunit alpha-6/7
MQNGSLIERLDGVRQVRRMLAHPDAPPSATMLAIENGIVPVLIELLQQTDHEECRFEAAWVVTNIAHESLEETEAVLETGPYLIQCLSSGSELLAEQCAWALGNIAGESLEMRDVLVRNGAVRPLIETMIRGAKSSYSREFLGTLAWTLTNFMRRTVPEEDAFFDAIPVAMECLTKEVMVEMVWFVCYLAMNKNFHPALIEAGVVTHLEHILTSAFNPLFLEGIALGTVEFESLGGAFEGSSVLGPIEPSVIVPCLRTVGCLCGGENASTDAVLFTSPAILKCIVLLVVLPAGYHPVEKEACWALSNVTGGTSEHVDAIVQAIPNALQHLTRIFQNADFAIKRELGYTLANVASDDRYTEMILQFGAMKTYVEFISMHVNVEMALLGVQFIAMVIRNAKTPTALTLCEELHVPDALQRVMFNDNDSLRQKASKLFDQYFSDDDKPAFD